MKKITDDLLNITGRLTELDPTYHVFYNNALQRFEIHNRATPSFLSLCFTTETLDPRVLETARRTRKENYDAIAGEIDEHNAKIENTVSNSISAYKSKLDDMLSFAASAGHEVIFKGEKL